MAKTNTKEPKKTIKINGKDIPLTKDGFPNAVHLSKEGKELVKKAKGDKKNQNKETYLKELKEQLEKLGK